MAFVGRSVGPPLLKCGKTWGSSPSFHNPTSKLSTSNLNERLGQHPRRTTAMTRNAVLTDKTRSVLICAAYFGQSPACPEPESVVASRIQSLWLNKPPHRGCVHLRPVRRGMTLHLQNCFAIDMLIYIVTIQLAPSRISTGTNSRSNRQLCETTLQETKTFAPLASAFTHQREQCP